MNIEIQNVIDSKMVNELQELLGNLGPGPALHGDKPEDPVAQLRLTDYWIPSQANPSTMTAGRKNYECTMQSGSPHVQKVLPILAQKIMADQMLASVGLVDCLFPPKFNKFDSGCFFNDHGDEPLARDGQGRRMRSDLAFTLFLSDPDEYEGGHLRIDDGMSEPFNYKGRAGSMVLYPSIHRHRVTEVTSGIRYAVVGWAQSLIADPFLRAEVFRVNKMMDRVKLLDDREMFLSLEAHRNMLLRLWSY